MSVLLIGALKNHKFEGYAIKENGKGSKKGSYLKTEAGELVTLSTCKSVLVWYCDVANDDGIGAYPGIRALCDYTLLSTGAVTNAVNALVFHEYLIPDGKSQWGSNNYRINVEKLGVLPGRTGRFYPVERGTLPGRTNPLREREESEVFTALEKLQGALNGVETRLVDKWREFHSQKWILRAIEEAETRGARSAKYVDSILVSWAAKGYPRSFDEKVKDARGKEKDSGSGRTNKPRRMPDL